MSQLEEYIKMLQEAYNAENWPKVIDYGNNALGLFRDGEQGKLRAHIHHKRANAYIFLDQNHEALKEMDCIHPRTLSDEPQFLDTKGFIFDNLGSNEDAKECFERAFQLRVGSSGPTSAKEQLFREISISQISRRSSSLCNSELFRNLFDPLRANFNPHERILFAYATFENALRWLLFYELHYRLKCQPKLLKEILYRHRISARTFHNNYRELFSDRTQNQLKTLWHPKSKNSFMDALQTRHTIIHGTAMIASKDRHKWTAITGLSQNNCYFSLISYLRFFIGLNSLFEDQIKQDGLGNGFGLFSPAQRGLGNSSGILDERQTILISRAIGIEPANSLWRRFST